MFNPMPERFEVSGDDVRAAREHFDKHLADELKDTSKNLIDEGLDISGMISFAMTFERLHGLLREHLPLAARAAYDEATKLREAAKDLAED